MNDEVADRICEKLDAVDQKVDELNHLITGNGTPERGMIVRLFAIEQRQKQWAWAIGLVLAAVATASGTVVVTAIIRAIEAGSK